MHRMGLNCNRNVHIKWQKWDEEREREGEKERQNKYEYKKQHEIKKMFECVLIHAIDFPSFFPMLVLPLHFSHS